ncbi:hypothetical protein D3C80_1613220 [compost metagenome]
MITEILQQILLGSPVLCEYDDLFIHFPDQLHRLLRLGVRLDCTDTLQQLHHPVTFGRIGRQFFDQINESNEYGVTAAADFTLQCYKGEHAAEIAA